MDLTNYQLTWSQDFTTMTNLSVSAWGPAGPGGTTWIAHTPWNGDWCTFLDGTVPYHPFHLGDGNLLIRAQKEGKGYSAGLLSSMDAQGRGFSQKWGYFEMKAQLSGGLGTWPAFWLMDRPGQLDTKMNHLEIDILEEYGDGPGNLFSTLHLWNAADSTHNWGTDNISPECSMIEGFHTYGLDIQQDFLTFYYDRRRIWQYPNTIPGFADKYDRDFFVLVDLAYGGGGNDNNVTNLDSGPQDMLVEYVKVWQGAGGSKGPNSTAPWDAATFKTAGLTLKPSDQVNINGVNLVFTTTGSLQVTDAKGATLWQSGSSSPCSTGCTAVFQNDGNFVLNDKDGKAYWGTSTWANNMGSMALYNKPPYLQIYDSKCTLLWYSK